MLLCLHLLKVSGQFYALVVLPTRNVGRTLVGLQIWCGRGVEEINSTLFGHQNSDIPTCRLLTLWSLILKNYLKDFNCCDSNTACARKMFLT